MNVQREIMETTGSSQSDSDHETPLLRRSSDEGEGTRKSVFQGVAKLFSGDYQRIKDNEDDDKVVEGSSSEFSSISLLSSNSSDTLGSTTGDKEQRIFVMSSSEEEDDGEEQEVVSDEVPLEEKQGSVSKPFGVTVLVSDDELSDEEESSGSCSNVKEDVDVAEAVQPTACDASAEKADEADEVRIDIKGVEKCEGSESCNFCELKRNNFRQRFPFRDIDECVVPEHYVRPGPTCPVPESYVAYGKPDWKSFRISSKLPEHEVASERLTPDTKVLCGNCKRLFPWGKEEDDHYCNCQSDCKSCMGGKWWSDTEAILCNCKGRKARKTIRKARQNVKQKAVVREEWAKHPAFYKERVWFDSCTYWGEQKCTQAGKPCVSDAISPDTEPKSDIELYDTLGKAMMLDGETKLDWRDEAESEYLDLVLDRHYGDVEANRFGHKGREVISYWKQRVREQRIAVEFGEWCLWWLVMLLVVSATLLLFVGSIAQFALVVVHHEVLNKLLHAPYLAEFLSFLLGLVTMLAWCILVSVKAKKYYIWWLYIRSWELGHFTNRNGLPTVKIEWAWKGVYYVGPGEDCRTDIRRMGDRVERDIVRQIEVTYHLPFDIFVERYDVSVPILLNSIDKNDGAHTMDQLREGVRNIFQRTVTVNRVPGFDRDNVARGTQVAGVLICSRAMHQAWGEFTSGRRLYGVNRDWRFRNAGDRLEAM
jgi:hypothetical protein